MNENPFRSPENSVLRGTGITLVGVLGALLWLTVPSVAFLYLLSLDDSLLHPSGLDVVGVELVSIMAVACLCAAAGTLLGRLAQGIKIGCIVVIGCAARFLTGIAMFYLL